MVGVSYRGGKHHTTPAAQLIPPARWAQGPTKLPKLPKKPIAMGLFRDSQSYTDMGNPALPVLGREIRCIFRCALRSFLIVIIVSQLGPYITARGLTIARGPVLYTTHARMILYGHWRAVDLTSVVFLCPIRFVDNCNRSHSVGLLTQKAPSVGPFCGLLTQKLVSVDLLTRG